VKPHYDRIRKVKTHSGSTAIQVGKYVGKNFKLTKHIGSAKETAKIDELLAIATEFIQTHSPQLPLNFNSKQSEEILFKRGVFVQRSWLEEAYNYLEDIYTHIGFPKLNNTLLKHMVMIRVLEPTSKIKSIQLLQKYFDITYRKTTVFRELSRVASLKDAVIRIAIAYAKRNLHFDFSLVFYDVTTLYFETFKDDPEELRKPGFSKDNKPNQPQILIGLVVNDTGFPIYYDIFPGNTFEGKTIIPVIVELKEKYLIKKFTVVADAGMLSEKNLSELEEQGINYVVGARIGTLKTEQIKNISFALNKEDKKILREDAIIYEYSTKRAAKDKSDTDKAIEKANFYLRNPAKVLKRSVFLSSNDKKHFTLNDALIEKHRLLEGIKGYRTNIKGIPERLLVDRYKDLWRIEQSFRIAKSDLEARPIYHRKENSVQYHILIVFMALCMARVIETKKGESLKKVTDELKDKWALLLKDEISGNTLKVYLDKNPH
jgi:transposase